MKTKKNTSKQVETAKHSDRPKKVVLSTHLDRPRPASTGLDRPRPISTALDRPGQLPKPEMSSIDHLDDFPPSYGRQLGAWSPGCRSLLRFQSLVGVFACFARFLNVFFVICIDIYVVLIDVVAFHGYCSLFMFMVALCVDIMCFHHLAS
jgi:hypothetical protein